MREFFFSVSLNVFALFIVLWTLLLLVVICTLSL